MYHFTATRMTLTDAISLAHHAYDWGMTADIYCVHKGILQHLVVNSMGVINKAILNR